MAGAVIQATGRLMFEDGMRSFVDLLVTKGNPGVRTSGYLQPECRLDLAVAVPRFPDQISMTATE